MTVVDDRPSFARPGPVSEGPARCCVKSFERCFDKLNITSGDYVAVVTRGHRYDMDCLRALLSGKEPAYMGMMGLQAAGIGDQESSVVGRLRGKGR